MRARSIAYQIGMARFPLAKTLAEFDFPTSPVNEPLVRELTRAAFSSLNAIASWSAEPALARPGPRMANSVLRRAHQPSRGATSPCRMVPNAPWMSPMGLVEDRPPRRGEI